MMRGMHEVRPYVACPQCGNRRLERHAELDEDVDLWTLFVKCRCGWRRKTSDVRAGV